MKKPTVDPAPPALSAVVTVELDTLRRGTAIFVRCADDYLAAVSGLSRIHEGKTLFEHSPSKVPEAYEAWITLNNTGKRLRECVDSLRRTTQPAVAVDRASVDRIAKALAAAFRKEPVTLVHNPDLTGSFYPHARAVVTALSAAPVTEALATDVLHRYVAICINEHHDDAPVSARVEAMRRALTEALAPPALSVVVTEKMMREALHFCPTDLPHNERIRWMAKNLTIALAPGSTTQPAVVVDDAMVLYESWMARAVKLDKGFGPGDMIVADTYRECAKQLHTALAPGGGL